MLHPVCVYSWCKKFCADPSNCCQSSNPMSCFQSASGTTQSSGSNSNSKSGSGSATPEGSDQCVSVADHVSACETATPGFSTLPNAAQASCLCFNRGGSYDGTVWGNAAETCYAAMQSASASPTALSAYESNVVGACTKFVNGAVLISAGVKSGAAVVSWFQFFMEACLHGDQGDETNRLTSSSPHVWRRVQPRVLAPQSRLLRLHRHQQKAMPGV